MIFYGLQTALFSTMFGDDEDEDKKKERVLNGMMDSILRGAGIGGAVVSTLKNLILEHLEQKAPLKKMTTYILPSIMRLMY